SSTPFGKPEDPLNPLKLYLTLGVSYVASSVSTRVKDLTATINEAMDHDGFSIVHVQSPCTTYNNTFAELKGNVKEGIPGLAWDVPEDHDPSDLEAAFDLVDEGGVPVGVVYRDKERSSFQARIDEINTKSFDRKLDKMIDSYSI
ncbi:MAG: 2-oxoacid:ferredoxin oxidoreductase subunit beta, partial [Chloroflexi bacterium]|nr:2-oxoacid:ferredoxin oxidoreductase subunit beta [Chloroflexota bacterium]